jgi:hypothetical protein
MLRKNLKELIRDINWKKSKPRDDVKATEVTLGLQYFMRISLAGKALWRERSSPVWHLCFDEIEAKEEINEHLKSAIMEQFYE